MLLQPGSIHVLGMSLVHGTTASFKIKVLNTCVKVAMTNISADICNRVDDVLKSTMGVMSQWNEIQQILLDSGLAYQQKCTPDLFLCHPLNRGGTGINPFSMHQKGCTIIAAGADMQQLGGSVAIEISSDERTKKTQVDFNMKMAMDSGNLLAMPSGKERYLTCAKGHTTQFCKAIVACCKTSQPSIAGPSGHLGSHLLRDKELSKMIHEGWQWTIVKHVVVEKWPSIPSIIESAGNSSNSTYEAQNEVQLMSSIVLAHHSKPLEELQYTKTAVELCHGGSLQAYAKHVGKFVQFYGGKAS